MQFLHRAVHRALSFIVSILISALALNGMAAVSTGALAMAAEAAPIGDSLQQLQQQLESEQQQLQQELARIHELEQRLAADEAAARTVAANPLPAEAPAPAAFAGNFGPSGFALTSADGRNAIRFRGNVSLDGRYYSDALTPMTDDTFLIRRLRPTLEGTLWGNFDFRFMPDFAQGKTIIQDAWGDVRFAPWATVEFGKFKAPVGLERLQLEQFARFIEVSLPSDLLPYRDLGVKLGGVIGPGVLFYDVGIFDGAVDGGSSDANSVPDQNSTGRFTYDARLFSKPFAQSDLGWLKGFGVGVAGTYVNDTGVATTTTTTSLLAGYKTPGQQSMFSYRSNTSVGKFNNATIADGIERRIVPQFDYYFRSLGLLGEYVHEDQQVQRQLSATGVRAATLTNTAWQIQGAWFLTGEDEAYDSFTPKRNFDFGGGGWGAWELVARYHELHFDPNAFTGGSGSFANPQSAPSAAYAIGAGINWYMNQNFKIQLDYDVTRYEGGAIVGNRPDERVLISQFALIF
jgi:phosphate-selective porin OprO/OprP